MCHIRLHIPVGCFYPHGVAFLFFPHFLLQEEESEESPQRPQLLKEIRSQELQVFMLTFCFRTSIGLLRLRLRCHMKVLTKSSQEFLVKQLAYDSEL